MRLFAQVADAVAYLHEQVAACGRGDQMSCGVVQSDAEVQLGPVAYNETKSFFSSNLQSMWRTMT